MRGVKGADLPSAARRALRIHGLVVAVCITLAVVNALVAIRTLGRVELDERWMGVLVGAVALVIAATGGVVLGRAVERVRMAGTLGPRRTVGIWLFLVAIVVGVFAGEAVRSVVLDGEEARVVAGYVSSCTGGRVPGCYGSWELDGQVYTGSVPFRYDRLGEIVEFEVSAARPDLVLTQRDPLLTGYGVWPAAAGMIVLAVRWTGAVRVLRRSLRAVALDPTVSGRA
jgi:hypothetical protein